MSLHNFKSSFSFQITNLIHQEETIKKSVIIQGVKLIFFSDSHLAPKLFKVVANSKKLVAIFKHKQTLFFTLSSF